MYEDAADYINAEQDIIDIIETKILEIPNRDIKIEFDTSEFIGTGDLLSELRKKIPQKQETVNIRKITESAGITDCDIDADVTVSYTPIDEKIKLVTAESGVYEARLKIDRSDYNRYAQTLSVYMLRPLSGILGILRSGLAKRKFFEKASDDELLNYLEESKLKTDNACSALANFIIDAAKEKLKSPSGATESYGAT